MLMLMLINSIMQSSPHPSSLMHPHIRRREQALTSHIHAMEPLPIRILHLTDLCTLRKQQLILSPSRRIPRPLRQDPPPTAAIRRELCARGKRLPRRLSRIARDDPFALDLAFVPCPALRPRVIGEWLHTEAAPAYEVVEHVALLAGPFALLEADDDHPVALGATPPACGTVVRGDDLVVEERVVATLANVVVAGARVGDDRADTFEAVEATLGRGDGAATYIAGCDECHDLEGTDTSCVQPDHHGCG